MTVPRACLRKKHCYEELSLELDAFLFLDLEAWQTIQVIGAKLEGEAPGGRQPRLLSPKASSPLTPSSPRVHFSVRVGSLTSVRPSLLCRLLLHLFQLLLCLRSAHSQQVIHLVLRLLLSKCCGHQQSLFELFVFLASSFVILIVLLVVFRPSTVVLNTVVLLRTRSILRNGNEPPRGRVFVCLLRLECRTTVNVCLCVSVKIGCQQLL